ncbi:GGDEF domain-containing protein [Roseospira visakhapatnamensis]|uniref:diguanylate cyclase n=1 Tax=Roseospira visakhapatnamensis TaxID=390880 RepID=A0A7W6WAA6_9PROT|nr:GGDEF domain-containing protein [Roseospira visakhapatnamensis]MBB4266658.1 diguanylate cyclase [Roseospira visakhapatnamensis]
MIEYAETRVQALAAAQQAMESMARLGISPHPNNFTVWYIHHSNRLPDLSREINRLLDLGADFSPEISKSLHDRFIGTSDESRTLADAGERIEHTLEKLLLMIGAASRGTESYGATLANLSGRVDGADDESVQDIIGVLVSETQKMIRVNRKMGTELSRSAQEIHRLHDDLDKVWQEARTDGLTGIANRKMFDRVLRIAAEDAETHGTHLCLLMLDIDRFKQFNDTHGHQMGDQVLKLVARTVETCVRPDDVVARYGGEEFAVILPDTPLKEAVDIGDRVRTTVANRRITNRRLGTELGRITLSIGVSEFALAEPMATLIQRADKALYLAKRTGRNRVVSQSDLDMTAC